MRDDLFEELTASVAEGGAILRGERQPTRSFVVDGPDVKRIWATHQVSQADFASLLGVSVKTVRNWKQGRRSPQGPARLLLQIADKHPEEVRDVVGTAAPSGKPRPAHPIIALDQL